jgi:hypothetical protein
MTRRRLGYRKWIELIPTRFALSAQADLPFSRGGERRRGLLELLPPERGKVGMGVKPQAQVSVDRDDPHPGSMLRIAPE